MIIYFKKLKPTLAIQVRQLGRRFSAFGLHLILSYLSKIKLSFFVYLSGNGLNLF